MQASSRLPGGASKPVWRMALLPLLAPLKRSAPRSMSTVSRPASTSARNTAQPTPPPPTTTASWMLAGSSANQDSPVRSIFVLVEFQPQLADFAGHHRLGLDDVRPVPQVERNRKLETSDEAPPRPNRDHVVS